MKLQRLVEMIRRDRSGAEEWPVLFTCHKQNSTGEWEEVNGAREPIASVEVDEDAKEVLLIMKSDCLPLSVARLEQKLTELMSCHGEFMVDGCETPIVMDDETIHIDFPIGGAGRDEQNRCYLVVHLSRWGSAAN